MAGQTYGRRGVSRWLLTGLLVIAGCAWSVEPEQTGRWLDGPAADIDHLDITLVQSGQWETASAPRRHLGHGWHELIAEVPHQGDWVLDFRNSSVIGSFRHWVYDQDDRLIAELSGGQLSTAAPDYWLRHGRDLTLSAGEYRFLTRIDSPFLLAEPVPHLFAQADYARSAGYTMVFTLVGLGIFVALAFYYLVLGVWRRSGADLLYVGFILGNLVYNSTALLVTHALFPQVWFYGISAPILVSNVIYVLFVLRLLRITHQDHPVLFRLGMGAVALMVMFWPVALIWPQWSLELCRIGVGVFGLYGLMAGLVRAWQGSMVGRLYVLANLAFLVPAMVAITVQNMPGGEVFLIEHLGLLAVLMEVLMLAWVLSYQVGQLQKQRVQEADELGRARLLSRLSEQVPGMVFQLQAHADGRLTMPYVTSGIESLFELSSDAVNQDARQALQRIHPDDVPMIQASTERARRRGETWQGEFRMRLPRAGERWFWSQAHPELQNDGSVIWHGFISDVTARRQAEEEVRHLASHDPLTGMLNRVSMEHQLQQKLHQAAASQEHVALLFLDLDGFKPVNDSYGHGVGDELLVVMASRLKAAVRETDLVARIGGDEFVIGLTPVDSMDSAQAIAEELRQKIAQRVQIREFSLSTTASIGIALFPEHGEQVAQLTEMADQAMYQAKGSGRNRVVLAPLPGAAVERRKVSN